VIGPAIDAADLNDACRGAADAIDFLAPIGLTPPALLQIEIRPELPAEVGSQAVACWMVRTGRVVVLPHSQVRVRGQWLGQPMSRPLYRAIIAHEVAHALIGCLASAASAGPAPSGNASMGTRLPKAAHEYAAYVTLMASLPPAMRDAALAAYPQAAFASTTQINDLIYGLDPEAFGVAAWRHWQQQPDPMGFLRQVILGKAIAPLVLE
jgi:hypothetical protein